MSWTRRALLELGALVVIAVIVGFLGPFGTYSQSAIVDRAGHWWLLLMGAYLLVRPTIWVFHRIANATRLPQNTMTFCAVVLSSAPIAMLWRRIGQQAYRQLDGYSALLPFALLCALGVLAVTIWAERTDQRLLTQRADRAGVPPADKSFEPVIEDGLGAMRDLEKDPSVVVVTAAEPALRARLSPGFRLPIIALQSEDHYVRIHGEQGSELVLMRLRDAIAEMGDVPGAQVHRSWWIARCGVVGAERSGRNWAVRLTNGKTAVVARQSVNRLPQLGLATVGTV